MGGQGHPGPYCEGGRKGRKEHQVTRGGKHSSRVKVPGFTAKQVVPEKGMWVDTWL